VVVAFGGNALLKRGEPLTMEAQQRNARSAAVAVKQLVDAGYRVCVTHGNGPQVGLLAEQDPAVSECRLQGRCLQQLLMLMVDAVSSTHCNGATGDPLFSDITA
jgi:carbamate kinase